MSRDPITDADRVVDALHEIDSTLCKPRDMSLLEITTAIAAGMSANPCHAADSPGLIASVAGQRATAVLAEVKRLLAVTPEEA